MSVMGNLIPTVIKVGDRVILPQVGVTKIDSIDGELVACDEGKVLAILKSNNE